MSEVHVRIDFFFFFFNFLWHSFFNFVPVNYKISGKNVIIYFILLQLVCP